MKDTQKLIGDLQERAKELRCLYEVEKALNDVKRPLPEVMMQVVEAIGPGWQFPDVCVASIELEGEVFESKGFRMTACAQEAPISVQGERVGSLRVCYTTECPEEDNGPFLEEEIQLLESLADRLGHYLLFKKLQSMGKKWRELESGSNNSGEENWQVIIDLLRETDDSLFLRVSRKMLNFLGISEAQTMLQQIDKEYDPQEFGTGETNVPEAWSASDNSLLLDGGPFRLAAKYITGEEIIFYVQKWIQEDKAAAFLNVLDNPRSTLSEIQEALRRFQQAAQDGAGLPDSTMKSVSVSLTQRVLTEQLDFVKTAKDHVGISFFRDLMDRIIMPTECHGKLGGKAAGMLLAHCILRGRDVARSQVASVSPGEALGAANGVDWNLLSKIKIPRTWHIASDAVLDFIAYNDLEDTLHQKYKTIDEVRRDYPNIIRLFKNSSFSQFESSGRPGGHGLFREIQKPFPGQPGHQKGMSQSPAGRRFGNLRFHVRAGPHRVPGGTGRSGIRRTDGHPDPGSGGDRQGLPVTTAWSGWCRGWGHGPLTERAMTTRYSSCRDSPSCGSMSRSTKSSGIHQARWT